MLKLPLTLEELSAVKAYLVLATRLLAFDRIALTTPIPPVKVYADTLLD